MRAALGLPLALPGDRPPLKKPRQGGLSSVPRWPLLLASQVVYSICHIYCICVFLVFHVVVASRQR